MRIPVITESAPAQLTGAPSDWSSALRRGGAIGLGAIWAAVVAISVFAPDLVSGSEQDQVPIAAILTWVWA